jgi:hypothetical protein
MLWGLWEGVNGREQILAFMTLDITESDSDDSEWCIDSGVRSAVANGILWKAFTLS